MKYLNIAIYIIVLATVFQTSEAVVWKVGPSRQYNAPSAVAGLVADGDTVDIDAADYIGDVCSWKANNLLLRGAGGKAKLAAGGKSAEQKAIWVIKGDNTTVENIEFSNCIVPDHNGAGIRQEGINLIVRNCAFRRNEMGLLAGNNIKSTIIVEYSEFERSGYGDGYSHNIYINHIYRFVFRYNYSHQALIGHECKSRAHRNEILYNRLSNEDGRASREIDLPNGGLSIIMGNIIHQGINAENSNIIGYGLEGVSDSLQNELFVVNNTIVNDRPTGVFIQTQPGTSRVMIRNNFMIGAGAVFAGGTNLLDSGNNARATIALAGLENAADYNYRLKAGSPAIGAASAIEPVNGYSLIPNEEYAHPANKRSISKIVGASYSAGAYQYETPELIAPNFDDANQIIQITSDGSLRIDAAGVYSYAIWNILGQLLEEGFGEGERIIQVKTNIVAVEVRMRAGATNRRIFMFEYEHALN